MPAVFFLTLTNFPLLAVTDTALVYMKATSTTASQTVLLRS